MVGYHKLKHTAPYCANKQTCVTSKKSCVNWINVNLTLHYNHNRMPHTEKSADILSFIQQASYLSSSAT
jgi:hypothetical protein